MIQENTEINWLTHPTGDPFADVGGLVIEYLQEKHPEKSIIHLIEEVTLIYVRKWNSKLHSFFYNSKITHNSVKGDDGIKNMAAYFKNLFNDIDAEEGYCRITGRQGKVFKARRDTYMLVGSDALINFHHGFESGIKLSKEILIRCYFVPLAVELLEGSPVIVISNFETVNRFLVQKNINRNLQALGANLSEGILKSDFNNKTTALFDFARLVIESSISATVDSEGNKNTKGLSLTLYQFTNFSSDVSINIIVLPATVFAFYAFCLLYHKRDWNDFIYRQYNNSKFKNAVYNPEAEQWANSKEKIGFDAYRIWRNRAFECLLNGNSEGFRRLILRHSKTQVFNFQIIEQYQINIRNMDKRTLSKILELADFIIADSSNDEIKKAITRVNGQRSSNALRRYLLNLVADYNKKHSDKEKPLITIEEYADYLFPDGTYWNEIRDLLLIAIYQRLHEMNKSVDVDLEEEVENEIDN